MIKLERCGTCLCIDRRLVCLSKIQSIINEIQLTQVLDINSGVCWECRSNMVKFYKFRIQVKNAQRILSRNIEQTQIKALSALSKNTKQNYDFKYTYYYDPLVSTNEENYDIKDELTMMKEEADEIDDGTNYDEQPLRKVFADSIEVKNIVKGKKMLHKKKRSLKQNKKKIKDLKKEKNHLKANIKTEKKCLEDFKSDLKEDLINVKNNLNRNAIKKSDNFKGDTESLTEHKKLEIDKDVLKAKFETVLFTEQEMLKSREEKRNQANFKKIPFKCDVCVTGFTKKENYDTHLLKKHDQSIGAHTCSVCQTRFASKSTLTRHHTKHYLQYRCRLCEYKFSSVKAAINHGRDKHANDESDRIHCNQCTFVARTSKELSDHMKTEHSLVCNQCGVKFKGRNTLRAHQIRIHSVKREFTCDACFKTFINKSRLESHMARHSEAMAKRLAYCVPCRIQYKDIHVYRNHLRNSVYHVQDRVTCPDCGKKFASRVYWSKHYKYYHLRQSQYKCEDCDKLFISEWRLKIHKQTHHGLSRTRDHACAVCGNKFYTKATLLTHSLLHATSRAFMCARCGDTFRQRAALYTHARLVHPST